MAVTPDQVLRFVSELSVGERVKVKWRTDVSAERMAWNGVVLSVAGDKRSAIIKYDEDPSHNYALPPADGVVILDLGKEAPVPLGTRVLHAPTAFREHDPLTWGEYIEHNDPLTGRDMLVMKLREHFSVYRRDRIPRGTDLVEYDKTSFMEGIEAWITLAQGLRQTWRKPEVQAVVLPLVLRLCDHLVKTMHGAQAVRRFRSDIEEDLMRNDRVGKALAKAGSKNDPAEKQH